jgi:hypothetical protein
LLRAWSGRVAIPSSPESGEGVQIYVGRGAPLSPYVVPPPSGGYVRHPVNGIAALREHSGVENFRLHYDQWTILQRIAEEFGDEGQDRVAGQRLVRTP